MDDNNSQKMDHTLKLINDFKSLYQSLSADNIHDGLIERVYRDDIQFKDSFHQLSGITQLIQYFDSIYENVIYSKFEFHSQMIDEDQAMLTWTMNYAHPKLNGGKNIAVKGASHIYYSDKIYLHQDYIDGGEMLYEHIPVLGWVIKKLKARMA